MGCAVSDTGVSVPLEIPPPSNTSGRAKIRAGPAATEVSVTTMGITLFVTIRVHRSTYKPQTAATALQSGSVVYMNASTSATRGIVQFPLLNCVLTWLGTGCLQERRSRRQDADPWGEVDQSAATRASQEGNCECRVPCWAAAGDLARQRGRGDSCVCIGITRHTPDTCVALAQICVRATGACCCAQVSGVGRYPVLQQMYRDVRGGLSLVSVIQTSLLHHLAAARPPEASLPGCSTTAAHTSALRVCECRCVLWRRGRLRWWRCGCGSRGCESCDTRAWRPCARCPQPPRTDNRQHSQPAAHRQICRQMGTHALGGCVAHGVGDGKPHTCSHRAHMVPISTGAGGPA